MRMTLSMVWLCAMCVRVQFNYVEFMDVWQQTVPLGITVSLDMLKVKAGSC